MSKWLTVEQATRRVGRSSRTIRRWIDDEGMPVTHGRVHENDLLKMDASMRERGARRGRPRTSSQADDIEAAILERAARIAEASSTGVEAAARIRQNRLS